MKKIGLDLDGCIVDFIGGFYKWFDKPMPKITTWENEFVNENFHIIAKDKDFWMSLKPLISPKEIDFPVYCYITARPIDPHVSYKWLVDNGFPSAPVFGVGSNGSQHDTKAEIINFLELDIFVDDKRQHFDEINTLCPTCTCFLLNTTWTEWEEVSPKLNSFSELNHLINERR